MTEVKYSNIVVKIGSSTLAHKTGLMNLRNIENIVHILSDIKNMGVNIIMVSSGAIGVGCGKLGFNKRPDDMPGKQATAAVGQCELMYMYDKLFSVYNHNVAQVLLTSYEFHSPQNRQNVINTFERLKEYDTIPIVNENDTVAVEEIELGDNDTLSALVAVMTKADALIILSDIDGLYDRDPDEEGAALINKVEKITEDTYKTAGGSKSNLGTGGMLTKLRAAETVTKQGIDMHIINGSKPQLMYNIIEGRQAGTYFCKEERK